MIYIINVIIILGKIVVNRRCKACKFQVAVPETFLELHLTLTNDTGEKLKSVVNVLRNKNIK